MYIFIFGGKDAKTNTPLNNVLIFDIFSETLSEMTTKIPVPFLSMDIRSLKSNNRHLSIFDKCSEDDVYKISPKNGNSKYFIILSNSFQIIQNKRKMVTYVHRLDISQNSQKNEKIKTKHKNKLIQKNDKFSFNFHYISKFEVEDLLSWDNYLFINNDLFIYKGKDFFINF
jgi:DNA replication protein DnaD